WLGTSRRASRGVHRRNRNGAGEAGSRARSPARRSHEERVLGNAGGGNVGARRAEPANQIVTALLFWSSVVFLGYTYVGYPALIGGWARWRPRMRMRSDATPTVSIIIVAHNEGRRIRDRLENLISLDYPRDRVEILLASDGSDDDTVEQAQAYGSAGVRIFALPTRRGKPVTLNQVVPHAAGDIVLLGDARPRFHRP